MDRLSDLSGGITGPRKGTRLAWEPHPRKKDVEYATGAHMMRTLETLKRMSIGVTIAERCAHGVDRNPRYEAREEEPGDANPDRECARQPLPRHDIAVTNRKASDEGEINCVAERPALDKADQQAQGDLNRQNYRQDRPRDMNG